MDDENLEMKLVEPPFGHAGIIGYFENMTHEP